ncbi:chromosome segregation protein SMC [Thermaerobacter subterraneus]|uniref:Chromosome partition protein Smc n=1 Tax=Thermaerobacter subterraneus DSM 13965 TaxID=867903 RepID=K6PYU0_9FIRM|nr:chromosome segregation protein SMC [Thermaerobacter subterraneus]EKP93704.1 chromosome segregation protein SMC [Thermaerobacter subterraneus DSM 13965]
MYLKRLELYGFKSFADRTRLEFGPGITAIVGPNGSGKSNLVDAVRWVLGEQSARQLRGSRMEDVIFAGTATRKGVGLAEVVLVLDNEDGRLPIDYTEVTVARRVDRAGGSDYLLNGQRVRLRDVQELLYDTAIGREAYSVVGQGKIDEILSARDEDRRGLLEEAAGITRFKVRKKEALRRLEDAEHRLLRLGDILRELEDRLDGLTEQARRAHLYRQWRDELVDLEARMVTAQAVQAQRRLADHARRLEAVRQQVAAARRRLEEAGAARDALRAQVRHQEQQVEAAQAALAEAERALEAVRTRLAVLDERAAQLASREQELGRRAEELAAQRQAGAAGAEEAARRHQALLAELEAARQAEQEARSAVAEAGAAVARAEEALAAAREAHLEALQELSRLRNEQQARQREQAQAAQRAERLRQRLEGLEAEARRLAEEEAAVEAELERLAAAAAEAARREEAARRALEAAQAEARAAGREAQQLRQQAGEASSRLRVLEEMEREHEGFFAGVRAVLAGRDGGDPAYREVIGAVAELIQVEPRLERAVEVALGPALQHLITRTAAGAEAAIEALKRARAGRATFLPLDTIRPSAPADADRRLDHQPGAVAWGIDAVRFDPALRPALANLLGRILIAEDLPAARRLAAASGYRYRIVTLEGDVIHPGGAMTGGHDSRRQESAGLLARRRQVEALRQRVQQLAGALEQVEDRRRRAEDAAARAAADLEAARQQRQQGAVSRARLEQQRQAAAQQRQRLERTMADVQSELEELAVPARDGGGPAPDQVEAAEARAREAAAAVAAAETALQQARARRDQVTGDLARATARVEGLTREGRLLAEQLVRARQEARRLELDEDRRREEAAQLAREQAEVAAQRQRLQEAVAEGEARVAACRQALAEAREARARLAARLDAVEGESVAARAELDRLSDELRRLEVEAARLESERDRLVARLAEDFGVQEVPDEPPAGWQEGERRVAELRRRMAALGEVNLAAVEEHERVCQRYAFLERQYRDLQQAREALRAVLAEMDREMERIFRVTYERLRAEFRQVFRELFGGGHADLILGEGDALEAGVQVVAQPPGKKLQHLSLLSGGERALTAIALLLALIRVKPTPFCLLDEIDAALDDRNVDRFARYLRRFSGTQFIVITHQKGTMAAADTLYGVTMPESGVSRVVSVRLAEVAAAGEGEGRGAVPGAAGSEREARRPAGAEEQAGGTAPGREEAGRGPSPAGATRQGAMEVAGD